MSAKFPRGGGGGGAGPFLARSLINVQFNGQKYSGFSEKLSFNQRCFFCFF